MIMLKSRHFKLGGPSSEQCGRFDLQESEERMKKKPKLTGRGWKSKYKRMRKEEIVPVESALDKLERVVDQVREERVHSPPSKMTCHLKKKDVPCSDGINDSGRDLVLGEQDMSKEAFEVDGRGNGNLKKKMKEVRCSVEKNGRDLELGKQDMSKEASKVDGRGNGKSTIRDNSTSANEVHYKDRDHIPLKQKIKLEEESAGRDTDISVEDVQRKCVKRMKKLVKKQKAKIEEFHRTWEGIFSELEGHYKLNAAIIRSIYLASEFKVTDKLEISESDFAKKRAEKNLEKDMQLKELEAEQLAARNEEIRKADIWLAEAKARISGIADGSSKAQSSGSQNVETSKGSELKVHVGTKDIVPSTQKHGENIDPDCGNDEDVTCNMHNKNPSIELKISPRNEGEIGRKTTGGGISSSDTQKPDISQPKHSGDIPLEFPETIAEEIVNDTNLVNMSTNTLIEGIANTLIEGIAEVNAIDLPNADNSGRHGRISPASGESVLHDVQSVELHGDVPSKLPETVANENLDVDDVQSAELHGEVPSELPETVANENSDIDDVQSFELHGDLPSELPETVATENLDVDDVQSVELHEDVPSELPEAVANENLDIDDVQSFELHGDLPSELPETAATENLDIDDVQLVEMHGDVLSELPETEANENLDNANMMDSSNQTPNALFGKRDAIVLPDDEHLAQQKHFGSDGMHKGPTEPAEPVANEIVDIVNPEELSAKLSTEGFGEAGALHLSDASLSRSDETDRTTVDDHVSDGQVLETSEQTETFRHPCPLVPLQVQEVQNVVSVAVQVHDAGTINSYPSEIFVSKLVANSISNIEPQACEEPAIETQSSSTTAVSTSKIIDTVITRQSSLKSHGHDESIAKDKVTSQIEVTDLEIVDTAAPVSASEVVDTAETLQSVHELQEQVEPSTETRSMIEVTVSQNLSNAEEQVEDASTAVNDVSLEIGVSKAGIADNSTPVQSHIDAPPIESFSELPLIDLESQNHNMESNPSKAVDTFELPHDSVSQLMEDVLRVINPRDAGPENQSSPARSVQAFPSSQNYTAAEGVSQLTSHQADALNPLSLIPDPLMYELERNQREAGALQRSHQETLSGLKSEYEKEKEELIAQLKRKYKLKVDDAIAQYTLKKDELYQSWKKIVMNKSLADAFRFNSLSTSAWPLTQQGISASSMQCHQQSVRPTAPDPQSSCVIEQPLQQASVPHAPTFSHVTSQTGQSVQPAPVTHATRPAPTTNQHSAAQSVPHATGFNPVTSRNGQAMQPVPHATRPAPTTNQHSLAQSVPHATGFNPVTSRNGQAMQPVPHATRLEPFLNQNFAAQSVQAAQQGASTAATISNLRGMNSVTHFGQNFQSSPFLQASTPAAASSMTSTNYLQNLWNLRQQQQLQLLQQQILAAQQWPSNSQNFQHLGYPTSLSHHNLNPLQVLAQNHRNLGDVQGNWNSCGGAASAICLSDDD